MRRGLNPPQQPKVSQNSPTRRPSDCCSVASGWAGFQSDNAVTHEMLNCSGVRLSVHDVLGHEVSVLVNKKRDAGVYEV